MKRLIYVALILAALAIGACGEEASPTPNTLESPLLEPTPEQDTFESPLGLPNPASQHCEEQGYTLEMREEAGGTVGYCIFPDGTECEEWAYYRGECEPGTAQP
jgi:putative hemolysin